VIALHDEYKASWASSEENLCNKQLRNHVDPMSVRLLNRITDLGVVYVISSSHRKLYRDLNKLREHIAALGLTGKVIGATGDDSRGHRGTEIQEYLEGPGQNITHYVILDDSTDMLESQLPCFVNVDADNGLSLQNYKDIKRILELKDEFKTIPR
jgi:hypothetical protein